MWGEHWDGIQRADESNCTTDILYDHTEEEGKKEKEKKKKRSLPIYLWKTMFWLETVKLKTKGSVHTHCTIIGKFGFDEGMS